VVSSCEHGNEPSGFIIGGKFLGLTVTKCNIIYALYNILIYIYIKSKKSKAVPLHAIEAHWGRRGIAPTHS
jgi:hypothetical protein